MYKIPSGAIQDMQHRTDTGGSNEVFNLKSQEGLRLRVRFTINKISKIYLSIIADEINLPGDAE